MHSEEFYTHLYIHIYISEIKNNFHIKNDIQLVNYINKI